MEKTTIINNCFQQTGIVFRDVGDSVVATENNRVGCVHDAQTIFLTNQRELYLGRIGGRNLYGAFSMPPFQEVVNRSQKCLSGAPVHFDVHRNAETPLHVRFTATTTAKLLGSSPASPPRLALWTRCRCCASCPNRSRPAMPATRPVSRRYIASSRPRTSCCGPHVCRFKVSPCRYLGFRRAKAAVSFDRELTTSWPGSGMKAAPRRYCLARTAQTALHVAVAQTAELTKPLPQRTDTSPTVSTTRATCWMALLGWLLGSARAGTGRSVSASGLAPRPLTYYNRGNDSAVSLPYQWLAQGSAALLSLADRCRKASGMLWEAIQPPRRPRRCRKPADDRRNSRTAGPCISRSAARVSFHCRRRLRR
jgi:hypothetical protein